MILSTAINSKDTLIKVTPSNYVQIGAILSIDGEQMVVKGKSFDGSLTVHRGYGASISQSHQSSTIVTVIGTPLSQNTVLPPGSGAIWGPKAGATTDVCQRCKSLPQGQRAYWHELLHTEPKTPVETFSEQVAERVYKNNSGRPYQGAASPTTVDAEFQNFLGRNALGEEHKLLAGWDLMSVRDYLRGMKYPPTGELEKSV